MIEQLKASFNTTSFVGGKFNGNGEMSGHNLETDSVSAKKIKTNELIVGDNITMGPRAYISWGNVTEQPDIEELALGKIKATYIDANGVWTPNVYATNINVLKGKIQSAQQVNSTLYVGEPSANRSTILFRGGSTTFISSNSYGMEINSFGNLDIEAKNVNIGM